MFLCRSFLTSAMAFAAIPALAQIHWSLFAEQVKAGDIPAALSTRQFSVMATSPSTGFPSQARDYTTIHRDLQT